MYVTIWWYIVFSI